MNNIKYNALVWAEDAGKFAKEVQTKGLPLEINAIIVLGNELKIEDLKTLQEVNSVPIEIDNNYAKEKKDTELILLGRCLERKMKSHEENGIISFSGLDKVTQEIAKNLNIPIINWASVKTTKTSRARRTENTASKTVSPKKEKKIVEDGMELTNVKETKLPKKAKEVKEIKDEKPLLKSSTVDTFSKKLCALLYKSTLTKEEKDFFSEPDNIIAIKDAIKNASDVNIGFPFQLQMRFGGKSDRLAKVLTKSFNDLRGDI